MAGSAKDERKLLAMRSVCLHSPSLDLDVCNHLAFGGSRMHFLRQHALQLVQIEALIGPEKA